MRVFAPAKINLFLRVGAVRADGFHPLYTWIVTVGLFDTLTIDRSDAVSFSCDEPSIPTDDRNLVVKATSALRQFRDDRTTDGLGCTIHLAKQIPHGAGLGGGSSDAASALLALNRLWKLGRSKRDLQAIGATLGSDVPFFFHVPSAICEGRGEIVRPLPMAGAAPAAQISQRWALLILPGIELPTAQVYREFDARRLGKAGALDTRADLADLAGLPSEQLLTLLHNDLEAPAFAISETLGTLRDEIERRLNRIVRMSGSGSTLFTLFDEKIEANAAQQTIAPVVRKAVVVEVCPRIEGD